MFPFICSELFNKKVFPALILLRCNFFTDSVLASVLMKLVLRFLQTIHQRPTLSVLRYVVNVSVAFFGTLSVHVDLIIFVLI